MHFCDERTVLHGAGNALIKLDVIDLSEQTFLLGTGTGIGKYAVSLKQNVICYSERGLHPNLRFVTLSTGSIISTLTGVPVFFGPSCF